MLIWKLQTEDECKRETAKITAYDKQKTRVTVIPYIKADEIMCKEVGRKQIVRKSISLSSFNVNSNSLSSFWAVLPDHQTDRQGSFGLGHIKSLPGAVLATAAELSWTAGGFKTVKISNLVRKKKWEKQCKSKARNVSKLQTDREEREEEMERSEHEGENWSKATCRGCCLALWR